MPITCKKDEGIFHLRGASSSYVIKVLPSGLVAHLFWGPALRSDALSSLLRHFDRRYPKKIEEADFVGMLDIMPAEYPSYGMTDFRPPAVEVRNPDGSSLADLRCVGSRIFPGKPELEGLPSTYVESEKEAESLELSLRDKLTGLEVKLLYTVFAGSDAIARSVKVTNGGAAAIRLERVLSFCVDFKDSGFDLINLSGTWARERFLNRQSLKSGSLSFESTRGESSHQQSPFIALLAPDANEESGTVYGFSLVYSGNFLAQAEVDQFFTTRVLMGINPFDFSWLLEPGQSFQAPEAVMVHSASGLGGMSRSFHDLYRRRLHKGAWRDRERPVLVNNWEATYFDFDAQKIIDIAKAGSEAGIELFVLDDGWFGHRDKDDSSLGDWFVNERKLPGGLKDLTERVKALGLGFGLWFEPEMVSPDSELYRAHPDWCVHVAGRERTLVRTQCVLDVTRKEVRDYVVDLLFKVIGSAPIAYIKWDMNRPLTEMGSAALPPERQREFAHRYVLGVYDMMSRVTSRFPEILFESCSGGGARFDAGIMRYMPQAWTSDDMDPFERLKIQWSTSLVFPPCMMGAHVSCSPNHTTGRESPIETRAAVAMAGAFGYELDLAKLTDQDKAAVKEQVAFFKRIRSLVQFGDFFRLRSPYDTDSGAWAFVSRDKTEAFAVYVQIRGIPNAPVSILKLAGLDPDADYRLVQGFKDGAEGEVYGGDYLMKAGIALPPFRGDYQSAVWRLRKA
jgi:alpha-galactosidase